MGGSEQSADPEVLVAWRLLTAFPENVLITDGWSWWFLWRQAGERGVHVNARSVPFPHPAEGW